jgi:hypothetical protein
MDCIRNLGRPSKTVQQIRSLGIGQKKTQIFHREPRQIRETNRETTFVRDGGGYD